MRPVAAAGPVAGPPLLATATLTRSRWPCIVTRSERSVVITRSQLLTAASLSRPSWTIAAARSQLLSTAALAWSC